MAKRPSVRFWKSAGTWEDAAQSPWPQVAVAGKSNVGKSSLLNLLFGRRGLARTSSTPGRTQTLNLYVVDERFVLVDLPGYGYARAPREVVAAWVHNVRHFLRRAEPLRGVVLLVDIRRDPDAADQEFAGLVRRAGRPLVIAVTKADKVSRGRRKDRLEEVASALGTDPAEVIVTSARTGEGREALWRRVRALLEG